MTSQTSRAFAKQYKQLCMIALVSLSLTACSAGTKTNVAPAAENAQQVSADSYILGAGDVLRVVVFGDEELSGEFTIDVSGHISMPLIQEIEAAGHTAHDLEKTITDKLHPDYLKDPKVSVQIIEYRSVYVLGEVRLPGKYPYVPNMTLLQAVAVAGGHTYRADEDDAEISRKSNGHTEKIDIDADGEILPGDTIVVGRRWF
jgi:polysaccharide export outer membrane protein